MIIIIINFTCRNTIKISLQANWGHDKNKHRNKMLKIINTVVELDL